MIASIGILIGATAMAASPSVVASWTDAEYATASITATSMSTPAKVTPCTVAPLGLSATFSWNAGAGGAPVDHYVVGVYQGGTLQGSETTVAPAATPPTSVTTSSLLSTLLGGATYDIRVQAVRGNWRSPVAAGTFTTTLAGLVSGCTW
jgi:hypothetical protein